MGTTTYGGKGSKGRMANGDWPVGTASCRQEQYTMATCQTLPFVSGQKSSCTAIRKESSNI